MKPCRQNPKWVRGNGGTAHESYVWFLNRDGLDLSAQAYRKATLYEPLTIPEEWKKEGAHVHAVAPPAARLMKQSRRLQ